MKKLLWWVVVLALLLQVASSQKEDLTEEEMESEEDAKVQKGEESASPPFEPPSKPSGDVYFAESFTNEGEVWKVWVASKATKEGAEAKYDGKERNKKASARQICVLQL